MKEKAQTYELARREAEVKEVSKKKQKLYEKNEGIKVQIKRISEESKVRIAQMKFKV